MITIFATFSSTIPVNERVDNVKNVRGIKALILGQRVIIAKDIQGKNINPGRQLPV